MEQVNHPEHYKKDGKECIDCMIEKYGIKATMNFCELNSYKYRFRAGNKAGNSKAQDLAKAEWYAKKYIELSKELHRGIKGVFRRFVK